MNQIQVRLSVSNPDSENVSFEFEWKIKRWYNQELGLVLRVDKLVVNQ